MRLYVIDNYRCRDVVHPAGAVLEVSAETAAFLMADAPGCFSLFPRESVSVETVSFDSPPADKMLRTSSSVRKARTK